MNSSFQTLYRETVDENITGWIPLNKIYETINSCWAVYLLILPLGWPVWRSGALWCSSQENTCPQTKTDRREETEPHTLTNVTPPGFPTQHLWVSSNWATTSAHRQTAFLWSFKSNCTEAGGTLLKTHWRHTHTYSSVKESGVTLHNNQHLQVRSSWLNIYCLWLYCLLLCVIL